MVAYNGKHPPKISAQQRTYSQLDLFDGDRQLAVDIDAYGNGRDPFQNPDYTSGTDEVGVPVGSADMGPGAFPLAVDTYLVGEVGAAQLVADPSTDRDHLRHVWGKQLPAFWPHGP